MRKFKKGLLYGSLASLILSGFVAISGANASPLDETIRRVIRENPRILEAAANRRAIDHELKQARGLYYPQVDVELGVGPEWSLNSTTRVRTGRGDGSAGVWRDRWESRITLQQVLFDGFARDSEVKRQAARVDAAAKRVRERSEFVALDLVEAYLDILRYREHVELAKGNVSAHEQHLSAVRERVSGGQSGIGDQQRAESRLADAKTALIEASRDRDQAEIFYRRLLGEAPDNLSRPELGTGLIPPTVDEAVENALANNPTLHLGGADMDVSKAELAAAKSDFYPTVKLEAGASRNYQLNGSDEVDHDLSVMLRMNFNLYRGGIDTAKNHEFIERLAESRERVLRLERAVEEETRQSWSAMKSAADRQNALGEQAIANSQVVATYRQEFIVGQRDLVDVLDAENELFTAQTRLATSEYAFLFGGYRLFASMGSLLTSMDAVPLAESTAGMREKYGITPEARWNDKVPDEAKNPN